ncbi:amidase family protein [Gramella sp. AN32]|uniref:Amidase family protein n=1 Tax=Christiangramia antarctica TaxID=2058158 RepID=A0ABW5X9Q8_9FLAO|nr:amidase family protein [Gramella sp. AN32]MCM4154522.1 amidase [Gramella sp. AN32]
MLKKSALFLFGFLLIVSCKNDPKEIDNSETEIQSTQDSIEEIEYKVVDSKFIQKDSFWKNFEADLENFSEDRYKVLYDKVFEKSIPEIQQAVKAGDISYEEIALFYLSRINAYDREGDLSLNSIISLNPNLLQEARKKDEELKSNPEQHMIYGIPVLLKDNINTANIPTTAGAAALQNNKVEDAFIVQRLKANGALILGKANLSEWANFFCEDCPNGFSTVGGQTLNPYKRKYFDTGGSSSGSGVAVSANFAPVAVGSETSGSILSPASQNSVVGLKPTIGLLSRGGIVPISSTLDTPGPMTKSVVDNAILLSAMTGKDSRDFASVKANKNPLDYFKDLKTADYSGIRFGVMKTLMKDTLYKKAVAELRAAGAEIVEYEAPEVNLPNFLRLLNLDMKNDLSTYFKEYGGDKNYKDIQDVIDYNLKDSTARAPYGQYYFFGIVNDSASTKDFAAIKDTLSTNGKMFFDEPMQRLNLDAVLSINNYHAGYAAVAHYPAITLPMGYSESGEPKGLTIIAKPFEEQKLLQWAYIYEKRAAARKPPKAYDE